MGQAWGRECRGSPAGMPNRHIVCIAGYTVQCISAEHMAKFHTGYLRQTQWITIWQHSRLPRPDTLRIWRCIGARLLAGGMGAASDIKL